MAKDPKVYTLKIAGVGLLDLDDQPTGVPVGKLIYQSLSRLGGSQVKDDEKVYAIATRFKAEKDFEVDESDLKLIEDLLPRTDMTIHAIHQARCIIADARDAVKDK